jgi:hypothetical protein
MSVSSSLQGDDNLEGIRKREQEAIWQSTFSFPPDPHLATNTYGSFSFPYSLARRSISSFTFISWVSWNLRASASIRTSSRTRTESRIPSKVGPNRLSHFASLGSRHFVSLPLLLHFARGYHRLESEFELASHNEPHIGPRSNIQPCRFSLDVIVDKREYAYGRKSKMGTFTDALMAEAKKKGWTVISMKNDWKRIFAFEQ